MFAKGPEIIAKPTMPLGVPAQESKSVSSATTEAKSEKQINYEQRVAEYKKATQGLSSLYKHILWVLDKDLCSSGKSVKAKLEAMKGSAAFLKGPLIHKFNATQRGAGKGAMTCPFFPTIDLRSSLHLGTTRVWDKKTGMVDEARWEQLVKYTVEKDAHGNDIISLPKFKEYLAVCAKDDPEETDTGRHVQSADKGNSRGDQEYAAVKAWEEVYDRLTSGITIKGDPYMLVSTVREFYEDSPIAALRAECGLLPVYPTSSSTKCIVM